MGLATPIIISCSAALFIIMERLFPYNQGQGIFRDGFWVDLIGYGLIQSYLLGVLLSYILYSLDDVFQTSQWRLIGHWPIWVQVLFFVITHDLATYLIHRAQHHNRFLWRLHEAHHSCQSVDWLSGIRSHSLEICLYQSVEYLPIVLLGAHPVVPLYKAMANSIYGMFIHANLSWQIPGPLRWIFNGPEFHRWHHANEDASVYNRNFATKFVLWDHFFGTFFAPQKLASRYGDRTFPRSYLGQHLFAFRREAK